MCLANFFVPSKGTELEFVQADEGNTTLQTKARGVACISCDHFNLVDAAVVCPGGAFQPQPQPGYWIDPLDPGNSLRSCPVKLSCTGKWRACNEADKEAVQPACNFTVCSLGSAGRQCSICVEGFYKTSGNVCTKCSEDFDMLWVVLIVVAVVVSALYVTIFVVFKQRIPTSIWYPLTIGLSYWYVYLQNTLCLP